ncbi:ABC transporter ATP-binding protein [Streptomyces sp. AgN23]|uniref:ABC transporter ATP-binding protein n=1 Tax=Streptomyces sp. AgN23 TaxID=1188315 RepID=UPI001B343EAC|nr:ABC transporter ATP-binding protein [Streptomyces sp. AgN23]QTI87264.1 ABC transporter ATP-binding protein [Streptomyces sp. AgN23]
MLTISGLRVEYGKVPAVHDLDLRVAAGEIVALVGPNGAGKTSTLNAVFGLASVTAGTIEFEGRSLRGRAPEQIVRAGISLVPEGRHIFQRLTVAENLQLGLSNRRGREAALLDEVLDRFPVLRRYYSAGAAGLSGGEQQQLAIARALIARPRLLLLDEPSLGLAPLVVADVFSVLDDLRAQGMTVLLIEQNATRAIALADRGYVLSGGRIAVEGTREELMARSDLHDLYLGTA